MEEELNSKEGPWWPLALMGGAYAALCYSVWLRWGHLGIPIGSYWWDDLTLAGAVAGIRQGLTPSVDFWAPFFLPLYLKLWAENLVGVGRAFLVENLTQGALVLALFAGLLWRQPRQRVEVYVAGLLAVLCASLPFNIGTITEARLGAAVFCCAYNRLGGSLILLVFLLPAVRRKDNLDTGVVAWLATIFVLSWLLKVTVLQIVWVSVLMMAALYPGRHWVRRLMWASLVASLVILAIGQVIDGWRGYLSVLHELSNVRLQIMKERAWYMESQVLEDHRLEVFVYLLAGLLVALRARILGHHWLPWVLMHCIAIAMVASYMVTNFGDFAMMPALGALCTLAVAGISEAGEPHIGVHSERTLRVVALTAYIVRALYWALMALYLGFMTWWAWAFAMAGPVEAPATRSGFWSHNYVLPAGAWAKRPDVSIGGVPTNLRSPEVFASYIDGLDEAQQALERLQPDRSKSVYALDFPAFAFSVASGYRVPRGAHAWLLYGHEITLDAFPEAQGLFRDVDVLMVSKCSLVGRNRRYLARIYRLEIQARWILRQETRCWDIYFPAARAPGSQL